MTKRKLGMDSFDQKSPQIAKARAVRMEMWEQTGDELWGEISNEEMLAYLGYGNLRDYTVKEMVEELVRESVSAGVIITISRGYN